MRSLPRPPASTDALYCLRIGVRQASVLYCGSCFTSLASLYVTSRLCVIFPSLFSHFEPSTLHFELGRLTDDPSENRPPRRHHRRRIHNHQGPNSQKGAQRQLILARDRPPQPSLRAQPAPARTLRERAPPASQVQRQHDAQPNHAAKKTSHQNGEKCPSQAQKRSYHRHHFYVAHAHAFVAARCFVRLRQPQQQKASKRRADQSIQNARHGSRQLHLKKSVSKKPRYTIIRRHTGGKQQARPKP